MVSHLGRPIVALYSSLWAPGLSVGMQRVLQSKGRACLTCYHVRGSGLQYTFL